MLALLVVVASCDTAEIIKTSAMDGYQKFVKPQQVYDGYYKVGNPYRIEGRWYYPKIEKDYVEQGMASWYGPKFNKKATANGEIFDKSLISAAHRTLPLPSMVRVTNLENGKSMLIRVNDRGPFAKDRIIDLSEAAARKLGFHRQGTAQVRVEFDEGETERMFADARHVNYKRPVSKKPSPYKTVVAGVVPISRDHFVQTGAYSSYDNATNVAKKLQTVSPVRIQEVAFPNRKLYRVRLGPFASVNDADRALIHVGELGFSDAIIIKD